MSTDETTIRAYLARSADTRASSVTHAPKATADQLKAALDRGRAERDLVMSAPKPMLPDERLRFR